MPTVRTQSEQQTFDQGKALGATLRPGDVVALSGDLGAGKTVFTKGIAAGLGIRQLVNSPTFVIMKTYPFKKNLFVHIDCYRLSGEDDLRAIGADQYLGSSRAVTVVEWPERAPKIFPENTKGVNIKIGDGDRRTITVLQK